MASGIGIDGRGLEVACAGAAVVAGKVTAAADVTVTGAGGGTWALVVAASCEHGIGGLGNTIDPGGGVPQPILNF